jgi:hypothetical protein
MIKYLIISLFILHLSSSAQDFDVIETTKLTDITDEETELAPEVLENLETNNYIAPNERNPNFYSNFVNDRIGTLLAVGTFRALILFTAGKFDRLIMVDVAKNILAFNRAHLVFILKLSSQGNFAGQREEYVQEYKKYLEVFEKKSGVKYYWQCDEKWEKIIRSLQDNKIHVIRGNFASINSTSRLLDVLKELHTNITLDHSNLLQYVVDARTNYASTIDAFCGAAHNQDFAMLATTQHNNQCYRLWPFIISSDPSLPCDNEERIQWVYYYYPVGRAYLHAIDPSFYDATRLGEIELKDWQIDTVATQVQSLLLENVSKDDAWLIAKWNCF